MLNHSIGFIAAFLLDFCVSMELLIIHNLHLQAWNNVGVDFVIPWFYNSEIV